MTGLDKSAKKKLIFIVIYLAAGSILATYWYYYLNGLVTQSGMRLVFLSLITFIFVVSLFKGRPDSQKDSMADQPGVGGHEPPW